MIQLRIRQCVSSVSRVYQRARRFTTAVPKVVGEICIRNSLSNAGLSKDVVVAQNSSLTWYSCGPTVYDSAHLGHARTYVCTDIIRRIMKDIFNVDINFAMGITDIDDKIIDKGRTLGYQTWDQMCSMTRRLEDEFFLDMDRLNVQRPDAVLRVTEHMPDIVAYVERLVENGSAYVAADGVYFNVATAKGQYDKFGLNRPTNSTSSSSSENTPVDGSDPLEAVLIPEPIVPDAPSRNKKDPRDFALWKLSKPSDSGGHEQPHWPSPWGVGRPGWHIECSAMTHAYFGPHIDVHSGGIDLKFPHHNNEIAQCEAHNCQDHQHMHLSPIGGGGGGGDCVGSSSNAVLSPSSPVVAEWVRLWLHTGHLHIEGRKMSKSLKNFVSIREYFESRQTNNPADDFRLFCLQHRYSASLNYAPARIANAASFRAKVESYMNYVRVLLESHARAQGGDGVSSSRRSTSQSLALDRSLRATRAAVHAALADDFDTPRVLKLLGDLVGDTTQYSLLTMTSLQECTGLSRSKGIALHPVEPLVAASQYVLKTLTALGLRFPSSFNLNSMLLAPVAGQIGDDDTALGNQAGDISRNSNKVSSDAIENVLAFRSAVRQTGVTGLKNLKKAKKAQAKGGEGPVVDHQAALESHLLALLAQCDEARDSIERSFGIKIDDIAGDKNSQFKFLQKALLAAAGEKNAVTSGDLGECTVYSISTKYHSTIKPLFGQLNADFKNSNLMEQLDQTFSTDMGNDHDDQYIVLSTCTDQSIDEGKVQVLENVKLYEKMVESTATWQLDAKCMRTPGSRMSFPSHRSFSANISKSGAASKKKGGVQKTESAASWASLFSGMKKSDATGYWVVTEKVHGANFCFVHDVATCAVYPAKRSDLLSVDDDFFGYRTAYDEVLPQVQLMFEMCARQFPDATRIYAFAELFGGLYLSTAEYIQGIQPAVSAEEVVQREVFYSPKLHFYFFDTAVETEGGNKTYLDYMDAALLWEAVGVLWAEPLHIGSFEEVTNCGVDFQTTIPAKLGLPTLAGNTAEGVVIKPLVEVSTSAPQSANKHAKSATPVASTKRAIVKRKASKFLEKVAVMNSSGHTTAMRQHKRESLAAGAAVEGGDSQFHHSESQYHAVLAYLQSLLNKNRLAAARSKLGSRVAPAVVAGAAIQDILSTAEEEDAFMWSVWVDVLKQTQREAIVHKLEVSAVQLLSAR